MFAVSVLMIVPLKSGTAVGSHSLTHSLSSVGLLLSVNTAYLAFIVLVLLFVIYVSVNPEMVATSPLSLWFPPDRTHRGLRGLPGHVPSPRLDGLSGLLEPPLLGWTVDPATALRMGE